MTADIVLLTGATSGVGRAAAPRLAADGATVILTGRNRRAGEAVADAVTTAATAARGRFLRVDLADPDAVRELAATVRRDYDRLDLLCNNAGLARYEREVTAAGVELTFAVNHLAPFQLTALLASRLRTSAPARVVTTSSELHRRGDLSDLEAVIEGRDYDGMQAYADSKLANVAFTWELAARLEDTGVVAAAFHPGWVPSSGLFRDASLPARLVTRVAGGVARFAAIGPLERPDTAGSALADVAMGLEVPDGGPTYFDRRMPGKPAPAGTDPELRDRLWDRSASLLGLSPSVPATDPLA